MISLNEDNFASRLVTILNDHKPSLIEHCCICGASTEDEKQHELHVANILIAVFKFNKELWVN
jgi:hypothetical protein